MEPRTIAEWQRRIYALAREKGWYDDVPEPRDPLWIAARLALVHSEVSEALEAVRVVGLRPGWLAASGKPEGFASELADVVIRVLDLAESVGVDLERAIAEKHAFNETRSHRHGGKAL